MRTIPGLSALQRSAGKSIVLVLLAVLSALLSFTNPHANANGQELDQKALRSGESLSPHEKRILTGIWGHLEYEQIILEPSDYLVSLSKHLRKWKDGTVWKFNCSNSDEVKDILTNAGINRELCNILLSEENMIFEAASGLYEIRPPEHIIVALNDESRLLLYPQILPHNDLNPFYSPYALPTGGLKTVLSIPTGLPQEQLDRIQQLSYQRGKAIQFSDINLVFANTKNEDERLRVLKTISRVKSLSVKLRITDQSDLSQLATYWNAAGKNKDLLPILESVMRTSGIQTLDLIHLLPPTPRKLLHSYPSPDGYGLANDLPDCFWTAASFFSETPPDRHLDTIGQVIDRRYEKAVSPLQVGDLIVMSDKNTGRPLHACNYLAGNLVYTKNGRSLARPWVISTLENVIEKYLQVKEMSINFMRLKPNYQQ